MLEHLNNMIKKRNFWVVFGISAAMLVLVILALIMSEPSFSPPDSNSCPPLGACCIDSDTIGFPGSNNYNCVDYIPSDKCGRSGGTWGGIGSRCAGSDLPKSDECKMVAGTESYLTCCKNSQFQQADENTCPIPSTFMEVDYFDCLCESKKGRVVDSREYGLGNCDACGALGP